MNGEPGWISSGTDGKVRIISEQKRRDACELRRVGIRTGDGENGLRHWLANSGDKQLETTLNRTRLQFMSGLAHEFRALSDPLEMDGPVVAMWSAENGGPARAVVHNLKTGNYEAYLLKVGCSQ